MRRPSLQLTSFVKINNMHTDSFTCTNGLRQGDSLSPVLFAMSINDLFKRLSEVDKDQNMDILLYADDLAILADSRDMLQKKLNILYAYCKENNLTVYIAKSTVIIFNSRSTRHHLFIMIVYYKGYIALNIYGWHLTDREV